MFCDKNATAPYIIYRNIVAITAGTKIGTGGLYIYIEILSL